MKNDAEYEVGFKKPPKVTRFKKGKSGNPKGRPKQSRNLVTLIDEELDREVIIQENGRRIHLTKREALVKRIVNSALTGEAKATSALISMDQSRKDEDAESMALLPADVDAMDRFKQRIIDAERRKQKRSINRTAIKVAKPNVSVKNKKP